MRVSWALLLSLGLLIFANRTVMGRQAGPPEAAAVPTSALKINKPLSLVGCVGIEEGNKIQVTSSAAHRGPIYQFFGTGRNGYVVRGLYVIGRLVPTPNIAAQAGSIDPQVWTWVPLRWYENGIATFHAQQTRVALERPLGGSCRSPSP
jgi:hypothetical protein